MILNYVKLLINNVTLIIYYNLTKNETCKNEQIKILISKKSFSIQSSKQNFL